MKKQLHQRVDTDYVKHILGKHLSQGFPVEECKRGKVTGTNRGVCQKITNNINMLTNSNWHFPGSKKPYSHTNPLVLRNISPLVPGTTVRYNQFYPPSNPFP
jgi:hypothetical protein